MVNVFPRIRHPKVRGGQGLARACQPSSALACLKWKDQALESGFPSPTASQIKHSAQAEQAGGQAAHAHLEEAGLVVSCGHYIQKLQGIPLPSHVPGCLSQASKWSVCLTSPDLDLSL